MPIKTCLLLKLGIEQGASFQLWSKPNNRLDKSLAFGRSLNILLKYSFFKKPKLTFFLNFFLQEMSSFFRLLSIFSQFIEFFSICLRFSRDFSQSFFLKCSFSNLLRVSNFFDFIQVFRPFVNVLRASLSSHTRKEAFESVECDEFSASSMIRTQWARGGQWGKFFFEEL